MLVNMCITCVKPKMEKGILEERKKSGENKPEVMGKRVEQLRLDWMKEGKKLGEAEEEIR